MPFCFLGRMEREMNETRIARRKSAARRDFLKRAGAVGIMSLVPAAVRSTAWAAGSDAPEKKELRIGFIPLTDCSSVVMASVMEFDKKYGIKITPSKEASWAAVRDKLVNGELDAAHVLYGLIYGVQLGIGGPKKDMAILMNLNHNGQAVTLSSKLNEKGVKDGASLKELIDREKGEYTFAQTFPTGTHAMWIYYWLAAHGIHPFNDVKAIVVPPPQMVANMRVGNMDGFCVGEPWNNRAIVDKIGFTANTTQDIWKDHPEKTLGTTSEFVQKYPNTARAMTAAVIRMLGRYDNGIGKTWDDPNYMKFYNDGYVTFPFLSDGMWFMTQHRRWGLLKEDVDYLAVAKKVNRIDIYRDAAAATNTNLPKEPMRSAKLIDGVTWDGKDPKKYAGSFKIKVA